MSKRTKVTLYAEIPPLDGMVALDVPAQVTEKGHILVRELTFRTWRRVGNLDAATTARALEVGEPLEPWSDG